MQQVDQTVLSLRPGGGRGRSLGPRFESSSSSASSFAFGSFFIRSSAFASPWWCTICFLYKATMDPSIMKKLLEDDEDENMHSGADVEAFQAALNRDIGGDVSMSLLSELASVDVAVVSQGSNSTCNQQIQPFQTASKDEIIDQIQPDQNGAQLQEKDSSEKELKQHDSLAKNLQQQNVVLQESNHLALPQKLSQDDLLQRHVEQKPLQIPQTTGMQMPIKSLAAISDSDRARTQDSDSQYLKLQKMSNQQATTGEASNPGSRGKQVPFALLLPVLVPQLDKDRGMQLQKLFSRLKGGELPKEQFIRSLKGLVGEQVLRLAVMQVQSSLQVDGKKHHSQSQSSTQQPPGVPTVSAGFTKFSDPRLTYFHQKGKSSADVSHALSSTFQMQTDSSHSVLEKNVPISQEGDSQLDSHRMLASQIPSSSMLAANQDLDRPFVSMQGLHNPQQQQLHYPHASFGMYGVNGGNYNPYSGSNVNPSLSSLKQQSRDSPMKQTTQHQNMSCVQSGVDAQNVSVSSLPKLERQSSIGDPGRFQGGSVSSFANSSTMQQNPVPWQSSTNKEHNVDREIASPGTSKDDTFEKQPTRMAITTSASMGPSSSMNIVPPNSISSSITMQLDPNFQLGSRITSGSSSAGVNNKTAQKKPSIGQKKPLEALGTSPPPSSKKQKVSGAFLDQSIEQLNDVTAVSGVNLREEEEQLFSGPKEDSRVSEASRKVVQEEEERLILQKIPLQKKLAKIMAKYGLKMLGNDLERCLSLCVEERMRGLITNLIRLSKQRVDAEKSRHQIVTTSDVGLRIITMNRKAREEWEKKQAETNELRRLNEPDGTVVDGEKEKEEGRSKSFKGLANKEEDDKMRTTAANVAARAAVGGDDVLSKWTLMAEQARQKRGGMDATSGSQPAKDGSRNSVSTSGRALKDNQEREKRTSAAHGYGRKLGRNHDFVPHSRVVRNIIVKDVIAALEREPQMSKSTLLYRLYDKMQSDAHGG